MKLIEWSAPNVPHVRGVYEPPGDGSGRLVKARCDHCKGQLVHFCRSGAPVQHLLRFAMRHFNCRPQKTERE